MSLAALQHERNQSVSGRGPKIALVAIGIGRTQRGYERYFGDLFEVLRDDLDITLYKSGGPCCAQERVPALLGVATSVSRTLLPLGAICAGSEYRHYKHDCVAFGLTLLPDLFRRRYDLVHVIDYPLERVLTRLQAAVRFPGRLLYTNGCCMPPSLYPKTAHVHHVAQPLYEEALEAGIPASRMTLAPCGIHTRKFATVAGRDELRAKYKVPQDTFVVLAVTAVKRLHKRVDHIIAEVSRVPGDVLLWIDGNPEDPAIPALALQSLGPRCRITHVPSADVPELYRLADVMVHASLEESFGLAIVEGLSTGLPVLTHNSAHFQWLVQDRDCLVDMSVPGELSARLAELHSRGDRAALRSCRRAAAVRQRFDWQNLKAAYLDMYRSLAGSRDAAAARNFGSAS